MPQLFKSDVNLKLGSMSDVGMGSNPARDTM